MKFNIPFLRFNILIGVCLLATQSSALFGLESGVDRQDSGVESLEPYVVVATRTPLGMERVSPSVEYISAEEIDFWQDHNLVDTLSRVSGVTVKETGATGNVASVFVRGANSDQTSLLFDGRRLNPTFSGQYDLESLSSGNLESVQILKGGASVNYGSSGIGGVIDLRTRSPFVSEGFSGQSNFEIGSNAYQQFGFSAAYADEKISFSFSGSAMETDNERVNDAYERVSLLPRFDIKLYDHLTFEVVSRYSNSDKEIPGSLSFPSTTDYLETENWLLSPGIRYATDLLSFHFFYARSAYTGEGVEFFPFYNELSSDEVNLKIDYSVSDSLLLSTGGVYRNDAIYRRGLYENSLGQVGGFAQAIWMLSDSFELRGGLRYDEFTDYDSATTAHAEMIYKLPDLGLSFFAKISSAYAPPSGQDLAYDDNLDNLGNPVNTPLDPEESVSYELGIRQVLFDDKLEWSLVSFRNEIDELIVYESYGFPNTDTFNVGEATTEGIEFQLDYIFCDQLKSSLNYTYLTASNDSAGMRLAYRPRNQILISANYQPTEQLSFGINALGLSGRERDRFGLTNVDIEDYLVVNIVASWEFRDNWTLYGRIDNLLDDEYQSSFGYPSLGSAGSIGLKFDF